MARAGRFAPSPTGPLHLGSLLAAVASWLDARHLGAAWHVRMDDLDTPRLMPGAESLILRSLEAHGLDWDGAVIRQSNRMDRYAAALAALEAQQRAFYCRCSRRTLRHLDRYPGTCRKVLEPQADSAMRVRVDPGDIEFADDIQGPQAFDLSEHPGDFIVRRRDGQIAYQLATAVDDGAPEITDVVRGRDLLDNTPRQIFLMRLLGLEQPRYAHVPTLIGESGTKLSKQSFARPVENSRPVGNLLRVLEYLGFAPPREFTADPVEAGTGRAGELLAWAAERWEVSAVPKSDIPVTGEGTSSPPREGQ